MNLDKTLRPNIFIKGKFIILKIQILYQENMTLEEGARREPSSSGAPGTDDFRKYIECVCLEKPLIRLADNSNPKSGEHDTVRVGTTGPSVKRVS